MKGSNYLSCNICDARFAMYLKQKSKYQMYTNPYYTQKVGLSIYAPFKHTLRSSHSLRYSFLFACSRRSFTLLLSLCLSFTLFVIIYLMLSLFYASNPSLLVIHQFVPTLFIALHGNIWDEINM